MSEKKRTVQVIERSLYDDAVRKHYPDAPQELVDELIEAMTERNYWSEVVQQISRELSLGDTRGITELPPYTGAS